MRTAIWPPVHTSLARLSPHEPARQHARRPAAPAECVEVLTEFVERSPSDAEDVLKVQALLRSLRQR